MKEPVEITQFWNITVKRKMIPKVSARQNQGDDMKPVRREVWFEYVKKGWLPVSGQLRQWLNENGFEDIKNEH